MNSLLTKVARAVSEAPGPSESSEAGGSSGVGDDATPEATVARDMARRALPLAAVLIGLCAVPWGLDGALSAAFAVALVVINLMAAAWTLTTAARISYTLLMAAALFGYLLRLGVIFLLVFAVKDAGWVELTPLGLTLVATHLGLLVWELRYVSASLAFPGLAPATPKPSKEKFAR